jgi:hypothetical protein
MNQLNKVGFEDVEEEPKKESRGEDERRSSRAQEELEDEVRRYTYQGPPKIKLASWQENPTPRVFRTEDLGGATSRVVPPKPKMQLVQETKTESSSSTNSSPPSSPVDPKPNKEKPVVSWKLKPATTPGNLDGLRGVVVKQAANPSADQDSQHSSDDEVKKTFVKLRPAKVIGQHNDDEQKPKPMWMQKANYIASSYAKVANAVPEVPVEPPEPKPAVPLPSMDVQPILTADAKPEPVQVASKPQPVFKPVTSKFIGAGPQPFKGFQKVNRIKSVQPVIKPNLSEELMKEFRAKSADMRQRNGWEMEESHGRQPQPPKVVAVHSRNPVGSVPVPPPPPPLPSPDPVVSVMNGLKTSEPGKTSTGKKIVRAVSAAQADPREDLLAAIREHGGRANLRKVRSLNLEVTQLYTWSRHSVISQSDLITKLLLVSS